MSDELLSKLAQLQHQTAAMQALLRDAEVAMPRQAEGSDTSGTVQVTVGPDGLPASFRVHNDWARRLRAEAFGAALLEAFQAAIRQRMTTWSETLATDGWKNQLDQLKAAPGTTGRVSAPPPAHRLSDFGSPRSLDVVAEDALKTFDKLDSLASETDSPDATGTDRSGKLALALSPGGLVSCTADPRWVADQTAARLMNALGEALQMAKEALENSQRKSRTDPMARVDAMLAETVALLNSPDRLLD
ncbi:hypothetical protein M8C13_22885 [Crossiella sp. SN42]|uniref:hypothetical protein n=1 Tax=Crossiella sp. SN42 TaxID=2944808 RepID=UPI00207C70C8|nr:hypothetical protein [Crossiella sp. SN42]MCO1578604.1 hypothetical protein [Crossiella sp. SN42]